MAKRWLLFLMMLAPLRMAMAETDPNITQLQQQLAQQQKMLEEMQAKLAAMEAAQNATAAQHSDTEKLQNKVNALEEAQAQQAQQSQTIAQQNQVLAQQNQALSKKIDYVATKEPNLPKEFQWVKNVKFTGDLRYRYEQIDEEGKHSSERNRIRARIEMDTKVNDDFDAIFRIATDQTSSSGGSNGDPVSTNQTLGEGFSRKPLWLDWAYIAWHPSDIQGLNVWGGKMPNPFYRVGPNQLIWDDDLSPEGVAVQYKTPLTDSDQLFINGAGFWASQNASNPSGAAIVNQSLWGLQGGLKHTFEDKSYALGGVGFYDYGNTKGEPTLWNTKSGQGNTVTTNGSGNTFYVNDYRLLELFGEYGFKLCDTPASVYGDYVKNTVVTTGGDTGWLVGASLGKCTVPGSWAWSYDYRKVEEDAVVAAFNDSDFIGGGTNGKGHRLGVTYQVMKNVQAGLNYFMDKKGEDSHDYNRLQADVLVKF